jgi:hypothetical protein
MALEAAARNGVADGSEGSRSLRDLILASMALPTGAEEEPVTIEHEPGSPAVEPP